MTSLVECWKCSGTGQYLHFGTCYACKGTGKRHEQKQSTGKAWWMLECICLNPSTQDLLCHIHTYAECIAARKQAGLTMTDEDLAHERDARRNQLGYQFPGR
jgi:hypothetical protein